MILTIAILVLCALVLWFVYQECISFLRRPDLRESRRPKADPSTRYTIEKDWSAHGFRCLVMMTSMGHRCGYVGIPKEHPLYGIEYDESSKATEKMWEAVKKGPIDKRGIIPIICNIGKKLPSLDAIFNVHGGLTFSGAGDYPIQGSRLWWFGFDCAHDGDAPEPAFDRQGYRRPGVVRTSEYVQAECESLAEQLAKIPKRISFSQVLMFILEKLGVVKADE